MITRSEPLSRLELVDRCLSCGGSALVPLFRTIDRNHGVPGTFGVSRCADCNAAVQTPRPPLHELDRFYPEDYGPFGHRAMPQFGLSRWLRRALLLLPVLLPDPSTTLDRKLRSRSAVEDPWSLRVLDVGCGDGKHLDQDRRAGWCAVGVDMTPFAVERARRRGLDVRQGTIDHDSLDGELFDLIRLSHVIEHVPDPAAMLNRARELLAPGGRIHLATPNFCGPTCRLMGTYALGLDAPRHLVIFTREGLRGLINKTGLVVERELHEAAPSDFWASVQYWLEATRGGNIPFSSRRLPPRGMKHSLILRSALYPFWWALARAGVGDRMHFVLRSAN